MGMLKHLLPLLAFVLTGTLCAPAFAECGGSVQCIGIGPTPAAADVGHHGLGPDTFTMAFGNQVTGTASASQTAFVAAVTGPAGSMADLAPTTITGADAAHFSITGGTCSDTNGPVHGGAQCTITVGFNPTTVGAKSATVHVRLDPPYCGGCITERSFTVTGPAGSMANLAPTTITGADAAHFSITGGTCSDTSGPVHGGAQCTITVAFSPTSTGAKTATVHVPLDPPYCGGCITERAFTVTGSGVPPAPVITSTLTASGTVGVAFAGYQITATNSPTSFGATGLPAGLAVNASGFISGTPTAAGTFNTTITATNATGSDSKTLVFTINPPAPVITSAGTASGTGGQPFSYQITATNSPASFGATGLPPGVSVNTATGLVSGTPSASGTFNATVSATNVTGTGSQPVTITITLVAPVVTSSSSASATGGQPFTFQVTAGNLPSSFAAAGLPAGLTIDTATGLISGTPTVTGTFSVTVTASNSAGSGTQTLTITIALVAPAITSPNTASGTSGQPFSYQITAANLPTSFGASGLPAGLSVNASTGLISGTPTVPGSFNATITATNAAGTGSQPLTISLAAGPPAITSATTASGFVTQPFSYQITANNFPTSFGATGLPAGLSVSTGTGLISGTPTVAGTFNVTVTATNSVGTGSQVVAMTITLLPPVITSATSATGFVGQPFSYQITASNLPTSFGASGLPSGVSVSTSTGLISGTPSAGGTFNVTLSATNASGTGNATLVLAVGNVPAPAAGNRTEVVAFNTPKAIDLASTILGGFASVAIVSGPSHGTVTLNGSVATYTPATGYSGPDSFVYTATGTGGTSATATVSITVSLPPAPTVAARTVAVAFETATPIDLTDAISGVHASIAIATLPNHGLVSVSGNIVTYTPATGFFGEDSFTYTATGPGGTSLPATVRITVGTLAPSAGAATMVVPLNTPTTLDLRPFVRGTGITRVTVVTPPTRGRVTVDGTRVTYTPTNDVFGADSFTYAAIGNAGTSAPATVSVSITGRPDPARDAAVTGLLAAQSETAQRFAGAQIGNFQRRMESLHRGEPPRAGPLALGGAFASLATTGSLDLATLGNGSAGATRGGTHFWIGGGAQFGRREADGTRSGLDFTTSGVSLGADRRLGERLVVGVGVGAARDKSDIGADGSRSHARGASAAVYASFQPSRATFVDAMLGTGSLDFATRRFVAPVSAFAEADRDGRQLFGSVAAGYEHRRNGVLFSPYGRLDYSRDRFDAATESGAGSYALAYSSESATWLRGAIGLRAESTLETRFGWATPRVRAEYRRNFKGEHTSSIAYADLLDGPQFSVSTGSSDRNTLVLGLGNDFIFGGGLTLGIDYQLQRASSRENDQAIRINLSQELFGTGSLRWLEGFRLEPARALDVQVDAGFTFDDNVTRAQSEADKHFDRSFGVNVRKALIRPLTPHLRAIVSGSLGGEKFQYYNGLSRLTAGVKGEIQYRGSAGFGAPTFALFSQGATEQYESRLRDGERYSAGASVRVPVTDRIGMFGALVHHRRNARSHVFDTRENAGRFNLDFAFGANAAAYLAGEYRRGDSVTSANPFPHVALKHEGEDSAHRQVADDVFTGPQLTAVRFKGKTVTATLGYNFTLGPRDAFDISWRRAQSTPDNLADLVIGFYAPTGKNYVVNQFFVLYLLSF